LIGRKEGYLKWFYGAGGKKVGKVKQGLPQEKTFRGNTSARKEKNFREKAKAPFGRVRQQTIGEISRIRGEQKQKRRGASVLRKMRKCVHRKGTKYK